jgi:hypothetical protein
MPRPGGLARDCCTGSACGREVTVGEAPVATPLLDLQDEIRRRLGAQAAGMAEACDEVVQAACKWWPQRHMASIARQRRENGPEALEAIPVIEAKVREDLEARYGTDPNTLRALDLLVQSVVIEMCSLWFNDVEARIAMRRAMWVARL